MIYPSRTFLELNKKTSGYMLRKALLIFTMHYIKLFALSLKQYSMVEAH